MPYNFIYFKYDIKFLIVNLRYRLTCKLCKAQKKNVIYFVFRPQIKHPGLADRLKAIISLYNLSKLYGYQFKCYFKTPFDLSDYLISKFDWSLELKDLEYSIIDTRFINEVNWHKKPKLKSGKQYHCYCYSGNELPEFFPDTGYKWSQLFHEMFSFSNKILNVCDSYNLSYGSYISVHFRFVNALERFENTFFDNYLKTEVERNALINKCKKGIQEIINDNSNVPIVVFSDSKVFLESLNDMNVLVLDINSIGHTGDNGSDDTFLKSFVDLYMMSRSKAIYRVLCPEIYQYSCYALLAARIGDIPFYDKHV